MYNYCTLFDSNYLHKGLALYKSLSNVCNDFHLFVLAFDDACYDILKKLKLENMTVISLSEFETEELLSVKPTRNRAEYCWTSGPTMIYHFIVNYNLDHCTYLDADMMFFSNPDSIYKEIGENSIAITEHFTEDVDELGGRFCVQFMYFKNDEFGMEALVWWRDRCIEWCFSRFEDGKYGDQKYLDHFPTLFKNVCVLTNRGAGVANWNSNQYDFSEYGKIKFKEKLIDVIFYHYHGTRIERKDNALVLSIVTYDITKDEEKNIFIPYLELIKELYIYYLNCPVEAIIIERRKIKEKLFSMIKRKFRYNSLAQYLYYKVLKVKYNGYEDKKV